jgi:Flp pilus assembly protein TadD
VARAAFAANRPSIAARSGRAVRAAAARLLAPSLVAALVVPIAAPVPAHAQAGRSTMPMLPGQVGAPEPIRPQITQPYDGAIAAWRAGRADEALEIAERALRDDPRNPQLRFLRGVILAGKDRTDDALQVFRSMTEDFPELPEPYNNVAVILAGRGDWDGAREAIEQSIRAVPSYALAHENLGDVHLQLAARAYEQAGRLDPRNDSARRKLALARELIGRVQALPVDARNPRLGASNQVNPR